MSSFNKNRIYVGLDNDNFGGMTPTGAIIRDAQVFQLIAEDETCAGWDAGRIQQLYDRVYEAWEPYGHLVSLLPSELLERHQRIYAAATARAKEMGWEPPSD